MTKLDNDSAVQYLKIAIQYRIESCLYLDRRAGDDLNCTN